MVAVRMLVDPDNAEDVKKVCALQDATKVEQKSAGRFEVPNWDQESQKKVRDALLALNETVPDSKRMFGARDEVDPVRHLIGIAALWGGNPEKDAIYLNVTPNRNDGETVPPAERQGRSRRWLLVRHVYNGQGYIEPNELNAYSLNNVTARNDADGSVTIQFGAATARSPTVCLSCQAGTTRCVSIVRAPKS